MNAQSPFRKALKEARTVIVPALLLAVGFNLFASNRVPWIRTTIQVDTIADDDLSDILDTASIDNLQTMDTLPVVDTGLTPEEIERQRIDSIKKEQQRIRDSIAKATQDSIKAAQEAAKNNASNTAQSGDVKGVTTTQAKKILDQKGAVFIDARRSDQFAKGHIPGALNIFAYEFPDHIGDVAPIPKNKLIVVYCDGGECELSHDLAGDLKTFGFTNVVIYTGGWEEWSKTDYPKATGE